MGRTLPRRSNAEFDGIFIADVVRFYDVNKARRE